MSLKIDIPSSQAFPPFLSQDQRVERVLPLSLIVTDYPRFSPLLSQIVPTGIPSRQPPTILRFLLACAVAPDFLASISNKVACVFVGKLRRRACAHHGKQDVRGGGDGPDDGPRGASGTTEAEPETSGSGRGITASSNLPA
ncbi:hypothetical protein MTBSS4_230017 [Magnetospirillum sp. SS-4]|nr:hypothetical protein MTBSS4_230017 [Magnetospirillum sp. SS-4]